jgi:pyrroloquinoline quinone biosynthesis protein B
MGNRCCWLVVALLVAATAGGAVPGNRAEITGVPLGPRLVVLGTAQDGGVPQAGCNCARCLAARHDPKLHRAVASLAIWWPREDRVALIDATPDFREQLGRLADLRRQVGGDASATVDRHPLSAIFLTHAHMGHYLGLAQLGFEALNASGIPVFCSPRMTNFLTHNAPWDRLVSGRNIILHPIATTTRVPVGPGVEIEPIVVPHRSEYTDTYAYLIRGPHATVLYAPDTDAWSGWRPPLPALVDNAHVDIALLDGTFSDPNELPDRRIADIGHPLEGTTMNLLASRVQAGRLRVYFTHFNHSNPVLGPDAAARRAVEARGFGLLADGQQLAL